MGVLIKPPISGTNFSLVVQNVGTKMKFVNEDFSLPLRWRYGFSKNGGLKTKYGYLFSMEVLREGSDTCLLTGFEQVLFKKFSLRTGWRTSRDIGSPLTFGMGFLIKNYSSEYFQVNYAYSNYAALGNVHRLSITIKFQTHRSKYD